MDTPNSAKQLKRHRTNTASYHGQDELGRFRIKRDGKRLLVTGILYERTARKADTNGSKWTRHKTATTPGFVESEHCDMRGLVANCSRTGKSYRVVGDFRTVFRQQNQSTAEEKKLQPVAMQQNHPMGTAVVGEKAKVEESRMRLHNQLNALAHLRAAGLDPDLRMSFIPMFVQESRASLYRKMGRGFPIPIKRGRGSFWPMSQIEAYKAGTLSSVS